MRTKRTQGALLLALALALPGLGCDDDDDDQSSELSDPQVLGVLVTANMGEVEFSQNGVTDVSAEPVKEFAALMVEEHSMALTHVQQVAADLQLAPDKDSEVARNLETQVMNEQTQVQAQTSTEEKDIRFMCAQIRLHGSVLETIDESLEPSAEQAVVQAEVDATRPKVQGHLEHARTVVQEIGTTNTQQTPEQICEDRGGL